MRLEPPDTDTGQRRARPCRGASTAAEGRQWSEMKWGLSSAAGRFSLWHEGTPGRGHHHLRGNCLLDTHPSYIPSLLAASLWRREGHRWPQAQHRAPCSQSSFGRPRAGPGGVGPSLSPAPLPPPPRLPALPWNSRRPRCRDTSLSENSPVLFLTTRTMGFPSQNFFRGYLRGDITSAVLAFLRTRMEEEGTGSLPTTAATDRETGQKQELRASADSTPEPFSLRSHLSPHHLTVPDEESRPRRGAHRDLALWTARLGFRMFLASQEEPWVWAPWVLFHSPFIQMAKVKAKGGGGWGGGTGTGRARRGEARRGTLQRRSCYLFKRSLVSWKGRKHRISKSDLTHLGQHLTDRRGRP